MIQKETFFKNKMAEKLMIQKRKKGRHHKGALD